MVASKEARNARLDALVTAVDTWADDRKKKLEAEAKLLRRIMKGRTGAERLNNASVAATSSMLVNEISQFLTGD